jgi:hypothetical protein
LDELKTSAVRRRRTDFPTHICCSIPARPTLSGTVHDVGVVIADAVTTPSTLNALLFRKGGRWRLLLVIVIVTDFNLVSILFVKVVIICIIFVVDGLMFVFIDPNSFGSAALQQLHGRVRRNYGCDLTGLIIVIRRPFTGTIRACVRSG